MPIRPRDIEDQFEEAAYTLRRLPEKDHPRGFGSSWPPVVHEVKHAYGYTPEAPMRVILRAAAITRMEECFDWLMLIAPEDARIVWLRADGMRWRQVCTQADPPVHFMRNVLAHAGKSDRRIVSAFIATAFAQETAEAASTQWRAVADQNRPKRPKLTVIMDAAAPDVLTYITFPKKHRASCTRPICSIPDDHISSRRSAFFMARSVLRDIRNGVRPC